MRVAEPDELRTHAYPLLMAAISEAEFARWFPLPFHHVTDPREEPEPSKVALLELDGHYVAVFYGERSNHLTLRIPTSTDPVAFLEAFFREVPLPVSRIVWRRHDARLPREATAAATPSPEHVSR